MRINGVLLQRKKLYISCTPSIRHVNTTITNTDDSFYRFAAAAFYPHPSSHTQICPSRHSPARRRPEDFFLREKWSKAKAQRVSLYALYIYLHADNQVVLLYSTL